MKKRAVFIFLLLLYLSYNIAAQDNGIISLKVQEIFEFYNGPIKTLREIEPAENADERTDNRIKINYLNRHIAALKQKSETDISEHLKSIYKDSIITLYEELDKIQAEIITENIKSIDELTIYLAQFNNKKKSQDDLIGDIGMRVENLRDVLNDIAEIFDSYDNIIEKQNELITQALDLKIEAYKNTVFLAPGFEAASNLAPYISLGLGYIANEGRFSYGWIVKAGYSPAQDIVNVGVSVVAGVNLGRVGEKEIF